MCVLGYRFATDVMFQPGNGDRFNMPNYLVILTDGNSDNATATWNEAMRARAAGINIICVSNYFSLSLHTYILVPFALSEFTNIYMMP